MQTCQKSKLFEHQKFNLDKWRYGGHVYSNFILQYYGVSILHIYRITLEYKFTRIILPHLSYKKYFWATKKLFIATCGD
jgi:hypothetical protein